MPAPVRRLAFTPGMSMKMQKAGFFRIVFTAASAEGFEALLPRIAALAAVRDT